LTTIVTSYQLYAAARDLLESDTDYSIAAKQGLVAATFHDLFDPQTKLCRPFRFPDVRQRLKNSVVPFTAMMAGKYKAKQEAAQAVVFEADAKMRETPVPFFKEIEGLERGEVYVMWTKPEEADNVLKRIAQWSVKAGFGMIWLSRHLGDSEEFRQLLKDVNGEVNIAPADAAASTFGTKRKTLLNIPMMHLYVADGTHVLSQAPAERSFGRFQEGLREKKAAAIVLLRDGEEWPLEAGKRAGIEMNPDPDADVEESMTIRETP